MPIYEFCAENVTVLEKAFKAGAQRVELCELFPMVATKGDPLLIPSNISMTSCSS